MCARYSLSKEGLTFRIGDYEVTIHIGARFNIAPTQIVPVILQEHGRVITKMMSWGWKPAWTGSLLINAQAETVTSKPTFRKFFEAGQRCLIPADGFYEWRTDKIPVRFTRPGNEPFCFAGLWLETTVQPNDLPVTVQKFILLTTTPNETVGRVHNRMPLIVQPQHYGWWTNPDGLATSVLSCPDREELESCPVQPALNSVRNEGPELIRPYFPPADLF